MSGLRLCLTVVNRREGHGFASDPHSCPSEPGYLDLVQCPAFQALQRVAVHIWIYSHICNQSEAFSKQRRDCRARSFSGKGQRGLSQSGHRKLFHFPHPLLSRSTFLPTQVGPALTFLRPFLVLCVVDDVAQQEASRVLFRDGRPPQDRRVRRVVVSADVCRSADGG